MKAIVRVKVVHPMNSQYQPFQPVLSEPGLQRFGLGLEQRRATAPLSRVVHSYLQISTDKPLSYAVIPDGTQAVFISPQGSFVGGVQSQATDIPISQGGEYFGVRFYPAALSYFFASNFSEITDNYVDSDYFGCPSFTRLHERVYAKSDFLSRSKVCEQWLLSRFRPFERKSFDRALSLIYQAEGDISVAEIGTQVGVSGRHLNRLFRQYIGVSTKAFSQIIRIQSASRTLFDSHHDSAKTALRLGFFDQAHLLNQFKKQLLFNPSSFLKRYMSDSYNP